MASNDHLSERKEKARKIMEAPGGFMVCEGCDSIVAERAVTCPNCHGYRFDASEERVVLHARVLAARPQQSVTAADLM